MVLFILHETAYGYALFERVESDEVAQLTPEMQEAFTDPSRFAKMVKVRAFTPFQSAAHALQNINDVSEGIVNDFLRGFLAENLPSSSSKKKVLQLGVVEKALAGAIKDALSVECLSDETVFELVRGIRAHSDKLLKGLKSGELERAQLGLAHSYSRAKVKFNVHRSDNMIIQAIALLDQSDKDINKFAMRVREWYAWHFPELSKLVSDHYTYARLVLEIGDKSTLSDGDAAKIGKVLVEGAALAGDTSPLKPALADMIIAGARASMGSDISKIDLMTVRNFATQLVAMYEQRARLSAYLSGKMNIVAPNLASLIGNTVGARLIAHAGSLTNLAKYPASTVQILGAEKALFRALKTKSKTPKYGLIYHASAIGKTDSKNKGRISRYLANKCSIASRIDCFSDEPTTLFGAALRGQVDNRVEFYASGEKPLKNADVMEAVLKSIKKSPVAAADTEKDAKKKKRSRSDDDEDSEKEQKSSKKEKKEKKDKKDKKEKEKEKKDKKDKKEKKH